MEVRLFFYFGYNNQQNTRPTDYPSNIPFHMFARLIFPFFLRITKINLLATSCTFDPIAVEYSPWPRLWQGNSVAGNFTNGPALVCFFGGGRCFFVLSKNRSRPKQKTKKHVFLMFFCIFSKIVLGLNKKNVDPPTYVYMSDEH